MESAAGTEDWSAFTEPRLARLLDIMVAATGLLALLPFFLAISVAVKSTSRGPVIYCARRIGKGGRPFYLYKFRTMVADADKHGPGITTAGDSRVTRVGQLLRRTKLDELPQLFNIIRGEMSLIGPRPEDPRYVQHYTPRQRRVLAVRPGVTGAASIKYRNEENLLRGEDWERVYINEIMPDKLALELAYLEKRTLRSDLLLLLETFLIVLRR